MGVIALGQARQLVEFRTEQLAKAARDVGAEIEDQFATHHRHSVRLAETLASVDLGDSATIERWVVQSAEWVTTLDSLGVADANGRILAISRRSERGGGYELAPFRGQSVADREYFRVAVSSGRSFISPGFVSRGARAGETAFVVSAPIVHDGEVRGVVFGSKLPSAFARLEERFAAGLESSLIVLDKRQQVLYSSPCLELAALATPREVAWLERVIPLNVSTRDRADSGRLEELAELFAGQDVLYASNITERGWTVVLLRPQVTTATVMSMFLQRAAPALLLALLAAVVLAHRLSLSIMRPLAQVLQRVESFTLDGSHSHFPGIGAVPEEYLRMVRRLHRMAWRLHGWQQQLREALAEAKRARSDVIKVLVNREDEVRARTRELAEANAALERLSRVDPLTAVANRRWFAEALDREWRACLRDRVPISVIFIDIDHYKAYNDCYGHQAGDECLVRVAQVLAGSLYRPHDLLARYGGEEFAAVVTGAAPHEAGQLGERLRAAIESLAVRHEGAGAAGVLTASVGVATVTPDPANSAEWLLRLADRALYAAKDAGRNTVAIMRADGTLQVKGRPSGDGVPAPESTGALALTPPARARA